jgi:hypothetical protein
MFRHFLIVLSLCFGIAACSPLNTPVVETTGNYPTDSTHKLSCRVNISMPHVAELIFIGVM